MTNFFAYEDLTWPEIESLPREIPLIIPLGIGYNQESIAYSLKDAPLIGMLPALPYGWRGSGLQVEPHLLGPILINLVDSLNEDGFYRVFVVIPPGIDNDIGTLEFQFLPCEQSKSIRHIPPDSDRDKVLIIPIGHTEQHGHHLPMSTDTLIIDAIGQGVARSCPNHAVCLPTMPYGVSTHRSSFTGTLNCGGRAFEDYWIGIINTLVQRGFDRIYLISGHGGNCSFLVNVVKYSGELHRSIFCATSWLYLSGPQGIAALNAHRRSRIGGMGHACELETSLILHLNPGLVHMEKAKDELDFISTPSYSMDWVEGGPLVANPPWDDDTITGAYGAGTLATKEHGRVWLEAAIAEKAMHVGEINEQHLRRTARRQSGFGLWGKRK